MTALVAVHVPSITATFADGTTADARVVPITVGRTAVGLAVLAVPVDKEIVHYSVSGTTFACAPDGAGCTAQ